MHNIRLLAPRSHGGHNSISISGTQPRSRHRPHRRITGYHNPFDDEQSPSYEQGHVPELSLQKPTSFNGQTQAPQRPPPYSCTVSIEGVVEMRFERTSPFNTVKDAKWENVYVRLQGTMLELRQAKTHGLFTPGSVRGTVTGEPGKLLKRFTMQHAEAVSALLVCCQAGRTGRLIFHPGRGRRLQESGDDPQVAYITASPCIYHQGAPAYRPTTI